VGRYAARYVDGVPARSRQDDQISLLAAALDRARAAAPAGVVVFDLDSTLLDNRPRQARILQDFGLSAGIPELLDARPEHWHGWSLAAAMQQTGLPAALVAAHLDAARRFWLEWFFTSAYCRLDAPVPGAPAFVRGVAEAGAQIAYVTGRPRGMEAGTREAFRNHGFPLPDGRAVHLFLKPDRAIADEDWKAEAVGAVEKLGPVVAAFDNEPAHVNLYRRAWPGALVVHLETDHSDRPVEVAEGIPSVRDLRHDGSTGSP
jgi:hypothetical protein